MRTPVSTGSLPSSAAMAEARRPNSWSAPAWVEFNYRPRGGRNNPYESIPSTKNADRLSKLWAVSTAGGIESAPAVVDGVVYLSSINSSPAVVNGIAYVGSTDHSLYAF